MNDSTSSPHARLLQGDAALLRAVGSFASIAAPCSEGSSTTASNSTEGPPSIFSSASRKVPSLASMPPTIRHDSGRVRSP